ncbi:MAG: DNA mismatch repair protein MutS [Pyrinomonadaceae bacterium]|nr:DNA mismatch repair protein MutS [Pyrinomonadaceae bacterium]
MNNATPIRRQYLEIKSRHKDALLLFRLGDFYEAFDDDARILARELDIVLTAKTMGKGFKVPLAGVPFHSLERHLATLISRGHRVAICEQLTDEPTKGVDGKRLIERDVVRVVTPGTILEPALLHSKSNNYIAAFFTDGQRAGIAYADITTGDFAATEVDNAAALPELERLAPSEILLAESEKDFSNQHLPAFITILDESVFEYDNAAELLKNHFQTLTLEPFGLKNAPLATSACAAIIHYLRKTQVGTLEQLNRLTSYDAGNFMLLDAHTLKSLEIFESGSGGETLLSILDKTGTSMGARLLRRWLRQPLLDVAEIVARQTHLEFFKCERKSRIELAAILENLQDIERLVARAKANLTTAQELIALGKSLEKLPEIRVILKRDVTRFGKILTNLPECRETADLVDRAISDELFKSSDKTGIIKTGFSAELDKLRETLRDGKSFLADLEARERARSGIKSLRVTYNKIFGYFIEVTKSNLHLVPNDFVRKQTLVNAERFVTLELKEYESLVLNSQQRLSELEKSVFRQVCAEIGRQRAQIMAAARTVAYLDAIVSLAQVADEYDYCKPHVNETSLLRIKNGRHAVVERATKTFVANDAALGGNGAPDIALITGPNASGKSTYLRQIALTVLMSQTGSFVPASEAVIGLCDRIFTRIGLYDKIGIGESTFMTEMVETAEILHRATPRSLVLLDELGRGTSTFDGLAVARSVIEFIHNHPKLKTRTIFATHYHELTELEGLLPRLENFRVEIEENGEDLKFLYKISRGIALKSYGVYAAKLAGLPKPVVRRAEKLLKEYEVQSPKSKVQGFNSDKSKLEAALIEVDLDSLSPVEALMKLYELKNLVDETVVDKKLKSA